LNLGQVVRSLTSSIDDNLGIIKEVKTNVTEKNDSSAVLPPVIHSSSAIILPSMLRSADKTST